jgi:transcriptional regulator with XRE-family HTH domain
MKEKDFFTFLDELEKEDETLKKWGDLYRIEENIIKTLVAARKRKGLSQKDVAERTNLKQSAVARIETGAHSLRLETLIKVVDALGLRIDIQSGHCKEQTLEYVHPQDLFDQAYELYSKELVDTNKEHTYSIAGGSINENQAHEYSCEEDCSA